MVDQFGDTDGDADTQGWSTEDGWAYVKLFVCMQPPGGDERYCGPATYDNYVRDICGRYRASGTQQSPAADGAWVGSGSSLWDMGNVNVLDPCVR